MDDIKDLIPCTLMYVKGRTWKTIEVAEATMMPGWIHHRWPVPVERVVVKVTMIREGCDFKDFEYPDEDEGNEKLVDPKETFIL
jgi:hypothetical protein